MRLTWRTLDKTWNDPPGTSPTLPNHMRRVIVKDEARQFAAKIWEHWWHG